MELEFREDECDGWRDLLADSANPKFILRCINGHMLESPIDLSQPEIDVRCTKCQDMLLQGRYYEMKH